MFTFFGGGSKDADIQTLRFGLNKSIALLSYFVRTVDFVQQDNVNFITLFFFHSRGCSLAEI